MKRILILFSALLLLLAMTGCENAFPGSEISVEDISVFSEAVTSREYYDAPWQDYLKSEDGILGPGAEYRIELPPAWQTFPQGQKQLIIYSHGYVTPGLEFSETEEYELINGAIASFIEQGFAVAYSSYAESGWAVKDGTIRTRQLRDYFIKSFGLPDRIYLCGVSEGALIVLKLAEQNPQLFSGALAFAGPLGGAETEFAYILNTRLAFDTFFKEYLKAAALLGTPYAHTLSSALGYDLTGTGTDGSALDVHPDPNHPEYISSSYFIADMAPLLGGILAADPGTAWSCAVVTVNGEYLFPADSWEGNPLFVPEFAYTLATALWYNIYGTQDLLEKTHNKMPLDTTEDVYASFGESFEVERFQSEPSAVKYLEHWYQPDGKLMIPVVTLHISRDPAVPSFHEDAYAEIASHYPDMLSQITVPGFGHGTLLNLSGPVPVLQIEETLNQIKAAFALLLQEVAAHSGP
jgi:pimeloyl-ACP methyl ester carboxylesterase